MATHRRRKKGRGGPGTPPGARCWPGFRARPRASCLFEQQIAHCTANRACPRLRPIPPLVRGERGDQGLSSDAMTLFARASCAELACSERSLFGQALKAVPAFRRRSSVTRPLALLVNEERTRRISSRSSLCAARGLLRRRATSNALRRNRGARTRWNASASKNATVVKSVPLRTE